VSLTTQPALFERLFSRTLTHEGGFSDHPQDRGGATKYGITHHTLNAYQDNLSLTTQSLTADGSPDLSQATIASLTQAQAMQIYWVMYYQQPKIYLLSSAIQPVIFDMAVNHGPKQAIKILQHVLNLSGLVNISQDGQLGPINARACDQVYQQMGDYLINALCDERVAFYHRIVARQPNQQIFLNGWLRRAQTYYLA
jgi:lysozyme family protein